MNMAFKHFWKVQLVPNLLTKEVKNDFIAEVSTIGKTRHNSDVARIIKDEGAEWDYESILDMLNRGDRVRKQSLMEGCSVQTEICHITPRVPGNWIGSAAPFDPKKHKRTCDCSITEDLRKAFEEEVGVEVLGVKDSGARIGLVTDVTTGKIDGTITPNGDILIDGVKIRVIPADSEGIGIFFVNEAGTETQVTQPLSRNDPKKITCRVPALANGEYTLKIVTKYSNSNILLNDPRTLTYELPLIVK
ncbi:MAG: DUF4469 domain-containing protein [Prevotellaceae bacterium]|jgi:hypothetical protein|nr:DUF4469 domain-containing protein [Prevotellaceae bacterium]